MAGQPTQKMLVKYSQVANGKHCFPSSDVYHAGPLGTTYLSCLQEEQKQFNWDRVRKISSSWLIIMEKQTLAVMLFCSLWLLVSNKTAANDPTQASRADTACIQIIIVVVNN